MNNAGILGGTYHRDALVAALAAGVCSLIHTEERVERHGDKLHSSILGIISFKT